MDDWSTVTRIAAIATPIILLLILLCVFMTFVAAAATKTLAEWSFNLLTQIRDELAAIRSALNKR